MPKPKQASSESEGAESTESVEQLQVPVAESAPAVKSSVKVEKSAKQNKIPKNESKPSNRMALWEPSEEDYIKIRQLAELGWPSPKISEALELTPQQFAGGLVRYPRMKAEYDQGVSDGKSYSERKLSWMPSIEDIEAVHKHAKDGLNHDSIAANLKVSRKAFGMRMADTPQLLDAFEEGNGEYQAARITEFNTLVDYQSESLKHVGASYTNILKTQCGWSDKAQKSEPVEVNVNHRHTLNAPKAVKIEDLAGFAEKEIARANNLGEKMIQESQTAQTIIDVSAMEVEHG